MRDSLKKTLEVLAFVYFVLLGVIFPLYFKNGYTSMGSVKFRFFEYAGTVLCVMLFFCLLYLLCSRHLTAALSVTDWFVLAYGVVVCLSTISSEFGPDSYYGSALWGSKGWNMGFVTQMLLVLIYFMLSRFFLWEKLGIHLLLGVSGVVFVLGSCNRFGFYPIPMESAGPGFISTLGNINWYCGYFAVVFALGYGLYLEAATKRRKRFYGVYLFIGFMTGITQGSDSGYLVVLVLFVAGCFWCFRGSHGVKRWLETVLLFFAAASCTWCFRVLFPDSLTYETPLINLLTGSCLPLVGLLSTLLLSWLVSFVDKKWKTPDRLWTILRFLVPGLAIAAVAGYIALVFVNTKHPLWTVPLNGNPAFTFNSDYLNGRGTTWHAGLAMFLEFPLWKRLVGVGPDCFASYAYTCYQGVWELEEQFGELILTNAHNEALTLLVNVGLWGLTAFMGAFFSQLRRAFSAARNNALLLATALSLACYLAHNTVSFAQVINTPTAFLVLGLAEGMLRRIKRSDHE